jgi:hypothetical protein
MIFATILYKFCLKETLILRQKSNIEMLEILLFKFTPVMSWWLEEYVYHVIGCLGQNKYVEDCLKEIWIEWNPLASGTIERHWYFNVAGILHVDHVEWWQSENANWNKIPISLCWRLIFLLRYMYWNYLFVEFDLDYVLLITFVRCNKYCWNQCQITTMNTTRRNQKLWHRERYCN